MYSSAAKNRENSMDTGNDIKERLRQAGPWNYLIEIEPGVFTIPRLHWKGLWNNIVVQDYITRLLPSVLDMASHAEKSETTVIDIGCNEGWLSLLLHKWGYKRVVGIDPNENSIRKANFLKEYYSMDNVDFYCEDINDFNTDEKFDISIMLGVINHIHNPVYVLKKAHGFTNKCFVIDFDSFCEDNTEKSYDLKYETGLSSDFGNMRCHFEREHQMTSATDDNLVFQYSKQAMTMMMNFAGFSNIMQVLPALSTPPHYKNEKRVFLVGAKSPDKNHYRNEILIGHEYENARKSFNSSLPSLIEEGYKGFNIVGYGDAFFGLPQGIMEGFDVIKVLDSNRCIFGNSINIIKQIIDKIVDNGLDASAACNDLERSALIYEAGCDLILESNLIKAKEVFESLYGKYGNSDTAFTADICYQLGRIHQKLNSTSEAGKYWSKCLLIKPTHVKARFRLKSLEKEDNHFRCNKVFD